MPTDARVDAPVAAPEDAPTAQAVAVSVILPAYNEASNLVEVVPRLLGVLEQSAPDHEVLVVDDGSDDGTADVMDKLSVLQPEVRVVRLRRNFGKSTALQAGFDRARGRVIVLMDADGQDRPEEIPKLLAALDGGLDLATGRRAQRNDRFIKRNTSKIYNGVTAKVTGVPGRDFNSGLKAMRRELADTALRQSAAPRCRISPQGRAVAVSTGVRDGLPRRRIPLVQGRAVGQQPRALSA